MKSKKVAYQSMDEYIGTFPEDTQKILEEVRATIKAAAPEAEETISYNIPTFKMNGKYLIYFAGWKKHISLYPIPVGSEAFNKQIAKYAESKGTLKLPIDKPLPLKLITRIVKLKLAEHRQQTDKKT